MDKQLSLYINVAEIEFIISLIDEGEKCRREQNKIEQFILKFYRMYYDALTFGTEIVDMAKKCNSRSRPLCDDKDGMLGK